MSTLDDGEYDVIVIDAENIDARTLRIDVALTSGASKGDVASIRVVDLARDAIDLLGLPATLVVVDRVPRLHFE